MMNRENQKRNKNRVIKGVLLALVIILLGIGTGELLVYLGVVKIPGLSQSETDSDTPADSAETTSETSQETTEQTGIPDDAAEFNGHHYYVYNPDDITTWKEARQYCESKGGYLATITSKEENDFVYSYLKNNVDYESAYFGFTDKESEEWAWDNGCLLYTSPSPRD